MFDSPLEWCAVVRQWVALDEGISDCMRLQRCNASVCPKSRLFEAASRMGQDGAVTPTLGATREPTTAIAKNDRCIF